MYEGERMTWEIKNGTKKRSLTTRRATKKGAKKLYKTNAVLTAYLNNTQNDNNRFKKRPHSCARQRGEQREMKRNTEKRKQWTVEVETVCQS
jgi:hypothetical protein